MAVLETLAADVGREQRRACLLDGQREPVAGHGAEAHPPRVLRRTHPVEQRPDADAPPLAVGVPPAGAVERGPDVVGDGGLHVGEVEDPIVRHGAVDPEPPRVRVDGLGVVCDPARVREVVPIAAGLPGAGVSALVVGGVDDAPDGALGPPGDQPAAHEQRGLDGRPAPLEVGPAGDVEPADQVDEQDRNQEEPEVRVDDQPGEREDAEVEAERPRETGGDRREGQEREDDGARGGERPPARVDVAPLASELPVQRREEGEAGEESGAPTPESDVDASAPEVTPLGLYHLVSRTPDMYELYLKSGDREEYTELCYERETEFLGDVPSEYEDVRFEDWLASLKTARLLEDWANEVDEDRITERYGVGPGDIRGKVDTAEWLLRAAETLARDVEGVDGDVVVAVREARKRIEYGVREELLDLAGVRNVGRKRARRLFEAGIETRADLREADKAVVLGALRGRERTAERILEHAGREDPSMDGVRPDKSASAAATAGSASDEDGDGQASLGDFR